MARQAPSPTLYGALLGARSAAFDRAVGPVTGRVSTKASAYMRDPGQRHISNQAVCGAQPSAYCQAGSRVVLQWKGQVTAWALPRATCQAACQAVTQVPDVAPTAVTECVPVTLAVQVNGQVTGVVPGQVEYGAKWPIGGGIASTPGVAMDV
jgi:hypothetical protein